MKRYSGRAFSKSAGLSAFILFVLFIVLGNNLQAQNYVTTYAGTGSPGFVNGDTSIASFNRPFGICIDTIGNLYLADAYNNCIRKIGIDGEVSTFAGTGTAGFENGPDTLAIFNFPRGSVMDYMMNRLYVVDYYNHAVRIIHLVPATGIGENISDTPAIVIYPNPANKDLTISWKSGIERTRLKISNSLGKEIFHQTDITHSAVQLDISGWDEGLYIVEIWDEKKFRAGKKFVVL